MLPKEKHKTVGTRIYLGENSKNKINYLLVIQISGTPNGFCNPSSVVFSNVIWSDGSRTGCCLVQY